MRFLVVLFVLVSTLSNAQDVDLLKYVNKYREAHGLSALKMDKDLYNISIQNSVCMSKNDSLMHSGTNTYEATFLGRVLNTTNSEVTEFKTFIKKYFDLEYTELTEDSDYEEVKFYMVLKTIHAWHNSPSHKGLMLEKDAKIGSACILFDDFNYKKNYRMIGGKKVAFKSFISHWMVNCYATLNLSE